jgi:uncharacterized membrane protein YkoI
MMLRMCSLAVLTCLLMGPFEPAYGANVQDPSEDLPKAAAEAVKKSFPNATIIGVGREREHGVMLYEVNLRENGKTFELEVTADGVIGEIESVKTLRELSPDLADRVREATKGGRITEIERHERRAKFQDGRALPLEHPTVAYEVTYYLDGQRHSAVIRASERAVGPHLPEAIRKAIKERFPGARVQEVERDYALGIALFEVELVTPGGQAEAVLSGDGVLVEIEREVAAEDVPFGVMRALKQLSGDKQPDEIEEVQVHAVARLVPLGRSRTAYEAEWEAEGKEIEVRVDSEGKLLSQQKEQEDDDEEEEED